MNYFIKKLKVFDFFNKKCYNMSTFCDYYQKVKEIYPENYMMAGTGNIASVIASRISYILGLQGPALLVDTACSSSLVALTQACNDINNNRCETALVGGLNLLIPNAVSEDEKDSIPAIISTSYRTKTFSDNADGTGMCEAVIAIVVKKLQKAIRNKDHIYAVIKGSSVNNDGISLGLTAPNQEAQEKVLHDAWKNSRVNPEQISYIEAHGTGTELGDPIELSALKAAFEKYTARKQFCGIGSGKSYFGHPDSAAGLLGVLKCITSLQYRKLYGNANFLCPTKKFDFFDSPIYVVNDTTDWESPLDEPRICGVSAFGLSGTNCHVVLQEYIHKKMVAKKNQVDSFLLPVTAKSDEILKHFVRVLSEFIKSDITINLENLCYTMQNEGGYRNDKRIVFCFQSREELIDQMESFYQFNKVFEQNEPNEIKEFLDGKDYRWPPIPGGENIALPTYPFAKRECWLVEKEVQKKQVNQSIYVEREHKMSDAKRNYIEEQLKKMIGDIFGISPEEVKKDVDFFDIGFDSISIIQLKHSLVEQYHHDFDVEMFFSECNTVEKLSYYIETLQIDNTKDNADYTVDQVNTSVVMNEENDSTKIVEASKAGINTITMNSSMKELFNRQLGIIETQLQLLSKDSNINPISNEEKVEEPQTIRSQQEVSKVVNVPQTDKQDITKEMIKDSYMKRFLVKKSSDLTKEQEDYLSVFSKSYCEKFKNSIERAKECKQRWANSRFVQGYADSWKELSFPIMSESAHGVTMKDVDGNVFLDFCMGFGVNLFGYNNAFISQALEKSIDDKLVLGPITNEAAEVAELICKATKVERVAFCNSGTEAIMNIMRIARGATNRKRIVVFKNSYHGTFDGVYVTSNGNKTIPISIGTNQEMVDNITVLNYGEEKDLQFIENNYTEIAAVLVEPIQSRNPDLQPREFLHRLRKITAENNIILVFDEIINGFRLALGGAQEYYGVEADMVAYGKIIGGGLPIGIYAGKAEFMDRIDGGCLENRGAAKMVVQTGGTFCHHPLTMEASKAVLQYLLKDNGRLQKRLNYKTKTMADFINSIFEEYNIPLHISVGGSQFIISSEDGTLMRMLYYLLVYHEIYIWEGGTCYLSSVHTDEDILCLVRTVISSLKELTDNKCFEFGSQFCECNIDEKLEDLKTRLQYDDEDISCLNVKDREKAYQFVQQEEVEYVLPVTPMQHMVLTSNICARRDCTDVVVERFVIKGNIDDDILQKACDYVVIENPVLRSDYEWRKWKQPVQITYRIDHSNFYYELLQQENEEEVENEIQRKIKQAMHDGFNSEKSKIKFYLWNIGNQRYVFAMVYWNSLFDGWSSNCLMSDIFRYYKRLENNLVDEIKTDTSFIQYSKQLCKKDRTIDQDFWIRELQEYKLVIDKYEPKKKAASYQEQQCTFVLPKEQVKLLKEYARKIRQSLSCLFQTAWIITKVEYENINDVLVGLSVSGRNNATPCIDNSIGLYTNILPMYYKVEQNKSFEEIAKEVGKLMRRYMEHEDCTISDIANFTDIPVATLNECVDYDVVVCLNFPDNNKEMDIQIEDKAEEGNLNISRRFYVEIGEEISVVCKYNQNSVTSLDIERIMSIYQEKLQNMMQIEKEIK